MAFLTLHSYANAAARPSRFRLVKAIYARREEKKSIERRVCKARGKSQLNSRGEARKSRPPRVDVSAREKESENEERARRGEGRAAGSPFFRIQIEYNNLASLACESAATREYIDFAARGALRERISRSLSLVVWCERIACRESRGCVSVYVCTM